MPSGNWQRKKRKNLYVTEDGEQMMLELCVKMGLNDGGVFETAIRELYKRVFGRELEGAEVPDLRFGKAAKWSRKNQSR